MLVEHCWFCCPSRDQAPFNGPNHDGILANGVVAGPVGCCHWSHPGCQAGCGPRPGAGNCNNPNTFGTKARVWVRGTPLTDSPTKTPTETPTELPTTMPTTPSPTLAPTSSPSPVPTELTTGPTTSPPTTAPVMAVVCGAGTVLVGNTCAVSQSYCAQGTRRAGDSCVPDCEDLRRRGIACPHCDGPPTTPPPTTQTPTAAGETFSPTEATTTVPNIGATAKGGSDSGSDIVIVVIVVVVVVLLLSGGCYVLWRKGTNKTDPGGGSAGSMRSPGVSNPSYEQPPSGKTDGFGFADDGYLQVQESKK